MIQKRAKYTPKRCTIVSVRVAAYRRAYTLQRIDQRASCNVQKNVRKTTSVRAINRAYNSYWVEANECTIANELKQTSMIQQITSDRIANGMKNWRRRKIERKVLWIIHFAIICATSWDRCMQMQMRNFLVNSRKIRTRSDENADKLVSQSRKTLNWWIVIHFWAEIDAWCDE